MRFLLLDNAAEISLAKFKVLASQYCRERLKEMPEASLSAAGFNQSHMKVAWLAFPMQLQLSDKAFCPAANKYTGNRAECQQIRLPSLPLGSQTSFSQCPAESLVPGLLLAKIQPGSRQCRAWTTHSWQLSSSAAFLQLQLVHQNMHFSVSPPQWTLCPWPRQDDSLLVADWSSAAETW